MISGSDNIAIKGNMDAKPAISINAIIKITKNIKTARDRCLGVKRKKSFFTVFIYINLISSFDLNYVFFNKIEL